MSAVETPAGRRGKTVEDADRGILSTADWGRRRVRATTRVTHAILLLSLIIVGLGPILWLAKSAVTPTQDTLRQPLALWPNGIDWANLGEAWTRVEIDKYFFNTVVIALGVWLVQVLVATTAGYALSVLRPRYGKLVVWLVMATLFVPSIVLLVPLYLTIVQPPLLGQSLINTFWAVWLPAGANAFNVLLVMRFFDSLPREVFEAARMDGAGPYRLFWSVVLPMARPALVTIVILSFQGSWNELSHFIVSAQSPSLTTLTKGVASLASGQLSQGSQYPIKLAAAALMTVPVAVVFFVFQRRIMNSSEGAVKE